jgi:hypothetical protein
MTFEASIFYTTFLICVYFLTSYQGDQWPFLQGSGNCSIAWNGSFEGSDFVDLAFFGCTETYQKCSYGRDDVLSDEDLRYFCQIVAEVIQRYPE